MRNNPIVLIMFVLLAGCCGNHENDEVPTAQDADEAFGLAKALLKRHTFPESKSDPGKPAVYARPGSSYSTILIYGVTDAAKQKDICETLAEIRRALKARKIAVEFYREPDLNCKELLLRKLIN